MAPTTRSSAPSTPTAATASSARSSETSSTTPRKAPHCSKCGLPRKGHPRSSCPPSPAAAQAEENITEALGSMYIDPETSYRTPEKRPRRSSVKPVSVAQASLASISTDTSELLNRLRQPGIMDDDVEPEERAINEERLKSFITPKKGKARMPGTLITPSSTEDSVGARSLESFMVGPNAALRASTEERKPHHLHSKQLQAAPTLPADVDMLSSQQTSVPSQISSTNSRPLVRSMTVEERHDYLDHLTSTALAAPPSIFVLKSAELAGEQLSAQKLGFHSRSIALANGLGWLTIGMDEEAVQNVYHAIQGSANSSFGSAARAAVAGAVAGAVITFVGLAYS
ncbi:hypothetical protein HWV62_25557 [Athelia sp. TMB]|nr:hypothetical protein HWV62_25557 [Athelia sp. TMB]